MRNPLLRKAAGSILVAAAIGVGVFTTGLVNNGGGGAVFTANEYVVATGGSASCTRSATQITYAVAASTGHVCGPGTGNTGSSTTGWDNACAISSGGDIVGVKPGSYSVNGDGSMMDSTRDCSNGAGADVNPNCAEQQALASSCASTGTTANWVTYECADGDSSLVEFNALNGVNFFYANFHMVVQGSCYQFDSSLIIGQGGAGAGLRSQNIQFVGTSPSTPMRLFNYEIKGAKNVLLKNVSSGPAFACGKIDANVPTALRCTTNAWWDTNYSTYGTATVSCSSSNASACGGSLSLGAPLAGEPYVHDGDSSSPTNIRLQNLYEHDQVAACSGGTCQHPGCLLTGGDENLAAGNLIIDHMDCERVNVEGIELHLGGTVIENSTFTCPTNQLDTSGGVWAQCTSTGSSELGLGADAVTLTNVLIRHNDFGVNSTASIGCGGAGATGGYSNVRIIGNIIGGASSSCNTTGVSGAYNVFWNSSTAWGTNTQTLAGDPFTTSSPGTALPSPAASAPTQLNLVLTGSPSVQTVPNNGSPNADYNLDHDATGAARNGTASVAGAYGS